MPQTYAPTLFGEAASGLGRHPSHTRPANLSQAYVNPAWAAQIGACTYCGFCEKFGRGNHPRRVRPTTVRLIRGEISGEFHLITDTSGSEASSRASDLTKQRADRRHLM